MISAEDEHRLQGTISDTYDQIHGLQHWIGDERVSSRWWTRRRRVQYYIVYQASVIPVLIDHPRRLPVLEHLWVCSSSKPNDQRRGSKTGMNTAHLFLHHTPLLILCRLSHFSFTQIHKNTVLYHIQNVYRATIVLRRNDLCYLTFFLLSWGPVGV